MDKLLIPALILCDAGCKVLFRKYTVQVIKNNKRIIKGEKEAVINMWLML